MMWSLPISKNIASTLRAWRSEIIQNRLASFDEVVFKDFIPAANYGSLAVSDYQVFRARYRVLGKMLFFSIDISATLAAPLSNSYTIFLPLTAAGTVDVIQGGQGFSDNGGASQGCLWQIYGTTNQLVIYRNSLANYTAGSTRARINGFIEID